MTVLCSHHRIVEKDPSKVNPCWKSWTVFSLVAIITSSFVVSFSLHGLLVDYKNHCLLDARLEFLPRNDGSQPSENVTIPDTNQTVQYGIDEYWSNWSNVSYCETLRAMPLFQGICCIIWMAIFIIHGPSGIVPQPWRIVFPSLIFFLGCLVISSVTASYITGGLTRLCAEFQKVDTVKGVGCAQLILYFALANNNSTLVQVDKNFILSLVFSWIWVGATVLGFCIILLRIILMPDFELFRVVISMHGEQKDIPKIAVKESSGYESSEH